MESGDIRAPRDFEDLKSAWEIDRLGLAGWRGAYGARRLLEARPSTLRALILADAGETYFSLLRIIRNDEYGDALYRELDPMGFFGAIALSDQDDAFFLSLTERAESASEHALALALLLNGLIRRQP